MNATSSFIQKESSKQTESRILSDPDTYSNAKVQNEFYVSLVTSSLFWGLQFVTYTLLYIQTEIKDDTLRSIRIGADWPWYDKMLPTNKTTGKIMRVDQAEVAKQIF